jgi:poly-gamma-glutamate capsule biosynthesis protein CapA/YwtB (metallophosphatase superfamily)
LGFARPNKALWGASIRYRRISAPFWLLLSFACAAELRVSFAAHSQGAQGSPVAPANKGHSAETPGPQPAESLTVAAVGDIIATKSFAKAKDVEFTSIRNIIERSDVGFGNLEGTLLDTEHSKGEPEAENGGMWLIAEPQVAAELRSFGFRMLARANNHSTEWGRDGMRKTDRALDKAGIVHTGTGENRALARAAAYLTTPKGRVSLVSMASSFTPSSTASPAQPNVASRAGMNAIRTEEFHIVSPEMMDALVKIDESQLEKSSSGGASGQADAKRPTELNLFGVSYRVGANAGGSSFRMNPIDLAENLESIREGKKHSNFLLATIHTHEPGNWSQQPPDFLVELAHQCIDAGADEFAGHGPHQLRGIEIYKGRPIFYSLGNFVFEVEKQTPVPLEMYEALQQDRSKIDDGELDRLFVRKYLDSEIWYESVVAVTHFENGRLIEVRLYPVELGFASQDAFRGIPRVPPPAIAQEILKRLQELSEPFHTEIHIENNEGVIRPQEK